MRCLLALWVADTHNVVAMLQFLLAINDKDRVHLQLGPAASALVTRNPISCEEWYCRHTTYTSSFDLAAQLTGLLTHLLGRHHIAIVYSEGKTMILVDHERQDTSVVYTKGLPDVDPRFSVCHIGAGCDASTMTAIDVQSSHCHPAADPLNSHFKLPSSPLLLACLLACYSPLRVNWPACGCGARPVHQSTSSTAPAEPP